MVRIFLSYRDVTDSLVFRVIRSAMTLGILIEFLFEGDTVASGVGLTVRTGSR